MAVAEDTTDVADADGAERDASADNDDGAAADERAELWDQAMVDASRKSQVGWWV